MQLTVKSRNGAVPDKLKQYAEKKVGKLTKYFRSVQSAEMEQAAERGMQIIELSVEGDGLFLRSEERHADLFAAVDFAVDKLERQVKRFKTRARRAHQRPGAVKEATAEHVSVMLEDEADLEPEPFTPQITRRKRFPMKPMSAEEAAQQMELVSHDFFLFHNEESGEVNVLYRRRDGDYGLIEPEA